MANYIVFDNEGRSPDRYTIVKRESGDVLATGNLTREDTINGRYCGNCADHRTTLYGSGWRQMALSRRIIEAETDNYIRNAQLIPGWLGRELPWQYWPMHLLDFVGRLDKTRPDGLHSVAGIPYIELEKDDCKPSKTAMAL